MKIAIQFFGHLRTFELCYKSIICNVLSHYDCDVFMHTWDTLDHSTVTWHNSKIHSDVNVNSLKEKIIDIYKLKKILIEHQNIEDKGYVYAHDKKISLFGLESMIYSMQQVNNIRIKYQKDNNVKYDVVLFIRPDVILKKVLDIKNINNNTLYTCGFVKTKQDHFGFKNITATDVLFWGSEQIINKIFQNISMFFEYFRNPDIVKYGPEFAFIETIKKQDTNVVFVNYMFDILRGSGFSVNDETFMPEAVPKFAVNAPDVSVIVPIYNTKPYLKECINSLLNQSLQNLEIILVDNGSTDGSSLICDEYAKKYQNIRVFHKSNSGVSDARNFGIQQSKGEFIGFVDSDDKVEDTMFEELFNLCKENNTLLSICNFKKFNSKTKQQETIQDLDDGVYIKDFSCIYNPMSLNKWSHNKAWRKLYHKSLLEKNKFSLNLIHEDIGFWYGIMALTDKIAFTNKCLYLYRQDRDNSSEKSIDNIELRKIDFIKSFKFGLKSIIKNSEKYRKTILLIALLDGFLRLDFSSNHIEWKRQQIGLLNKLKLYKHFLPSDTKSKFDENYSLSKFILKKYKNKLLFPFKIILDKLK